MIDFQLSEGQRTIRDMVRYFARTQIRPRALVADRTHTPPMDLIVQVHQMGFSLSQEVREDEGEEDKPTSRPDDEGNEPYGSRETDSEKVPQVNRISVLATEELCWGCPAITMSFPGPGLAGPPVRMMGTPEQKRLFFGAFKGEEPQWGAYALSEPGMGSDAANISTTCRKEGGYYIINGVKNWITNGDRAEWIVVFATLDKKLGRAGHRAFLVHRNTPGFSVLRVERKMGLRCNGTAQLGFSECRVPADLLLGGEEYYEQREAKGGFKLAMKTFDATRPMVGAMAVGIARAAWEETVKFFSDDMKNRPAPVTRKIQEILANLKRKIDVARLLCWKAAWMADLRIPNTKEASIAKAYAGQMVQEVTSRCMELMGIYGAVVDNYVEKCFRDQKVFDIFEGTGQIQRIVISRRVFEKLRDLQLT